jgi:hypothetical protein
LQLLLALEVENLKLDNAIELAQAEIEKLASPAAPESPDAPSDSEAQAAAPKTLWGRVFLFESVKVADVDGWQISVQRGEQTRNIWAVELEGALCLSTNKEYLELSCKAAQDAEASIASTRAFQELVAQLDTDAFLWMTLVNVLVDKNSQTKTAMLSIHLGDPVKAEATLVANSPETAKTLSSQVASGLVLAQVNLQARYPDLPSLKTLFPGIKSSLKEKSVVIAGQFSKVDLEKFFQERKAKKAADEAKMAAEKAKKAAEASEAP